MLPRNIALTTKLRMLVKGDWRVTIEGGIGAVYVYGIPILPLLDVKFTWTWIDGHE